MAGAATRTPSQRKSKPQEQEQASREHERQAWPEGHYAQDCKVAVYNLDDASVQHSGLPDTTILWWADDDSTWWSGDQAHLHTQPLRLRPPTAHAQQQQNTQQQEQAVSGLLMAADTSTHRGTAQENVIDLMIDSGAATHVCPPWFAPKFQLQPLPPREKGHN